MRNGRLSGCEKAKMISREPEGHIKNRRTMRQVRLRHRETTSLAFLIVATRGSLVGRVGIELRIEQNKRQSGYHATSLI